MGLSGIFRSGRARNAKGGSKEKAPEARLSGAFM